MTGIILIFIIAVVAVLVFYAISNRSRAEVSKETKTPERPTAPAQAEIEEKK